MKPLALLLLASCGLAGCASGREPHAPVESIRYSAIGHDPFWLVTIGDDSIVLSFGPAPGSGDSRVRGHRYPRTLPRTVDGVRRWESSQGTAVISVEAFPGPCQGSGGLSYRDRVRVRLSGRELQGCGGPRLDA